jgi:FkbM family methyltransferase
MSLWIKEAGTMRWIDGEVRAGDIFMDIGANIGIYTLAAAHRVGKTGKVYAFEPHKMNGITLLRDLEASGLADRVDFFACALSDASTVLPFNYVSLASASSGSQLGHTRVAGGEPRLQAGGARDAGGGHRRRVDGRRNDQGAEPRENRRRWKRNQDSKRHEKAADRQGPPARPAGGAQCRRADEIVSFLAECGYALAERHHTRHGEKQIQRGIPLEKVAHNAIFRPRPAT